MNRSARGGSILPRDQEGLKSAAGQQRARLAKKRSIEMNISETD
jgi:hypothetical protein